MRLVAADCENKMLGDTGKMGGLPVLLSPNSRGQEMAKERNHTTAIMTATLLLEL